MLPLLELFTAIAEIHKISVQIRMIEASLDRMRGHLNEAIGALERIVAEENVSCHN